MGDSLKKHICFNCKDSSFYSLKNGWKDSTGEYVQLCFNCCSIYQAGQFCEMFHSDEDGWRDCESCKQLIHCGCIVSLGDYILHDSGGITCNGCSNASLLARDCSNEESHSKDVTDLASDTEREKTLEMTDNEKRKCKVRCDLSKFTRLVKKFKLESCVELMDSPFAFLLKLKRYELDDDLLFKLASGFDPIKKTLKIGDKRLQIVSKDFDHILKIGKENEKSKHKKYEPTSDMVKRFISGRTVCMRKVEDILLKQNDVDDLKRAFALLSLRYIVCPPSNGKLGQWYLKYMENVDDLKSQPWAGLAMNSLAEGTKTFQKPKGGSKTYLGGSMVFLQLYYLSQVTNKSLEELIYGSKESITSLVKSNEEIMIESQNKEEASFRTSEIEKFVTEKYHEFFKYLADTTKAMDDMAAKLVLKEKIYEMDNKVEYDEDTTRVGPFKVRTTQAPTVDDRKLLELCFGKVEEDTMMVGVEDNDAFHVDKNKFCTGLMPEGWISTFFINCVADMLCVRECKKGVVQRWFFPMNARPYRIYLPKRSRNSLPKRPRNSPEYIITKQQLQSVKQIFFPLYKSGHFYLIVFNTMEHRVEVWDTMKNDITIYREAMEHLCHFLDNDIGDGMFKFNEYTGPIVIDVLKQPNPYDCGVFVCRFMEFPEEVMELNKDNWISEEERCNMALRILKASENFFSHILVDEAARGNKLSKPIGKEGKKPRRKE